MTKEELKKEFEKYLKDSSDYYDPREPLTERKLLQMWLDCAEPREKRIAELEEKISVLLSCKNCPENKGGYICEKEYENKCLAQKIQFIKELQEENAELKTLIKSEHEIEARKNNSLISKLTKAKEIIKLLLWDIRNRSYEPVKDIERAEQFLKEVK